MRIKVKVKPNSKRQTIEEIGKDEFIIRLTQILHQYVSINVLKAKGTRAKDKIN